MAIKKQVRQLSASRESIESLVNEALAEGWDFHGPCTHDANAEWFTQWMVKVTKTKPGKVAKNGNFYPEAFEFIWKHYPKRAGSNPKATAFRAYNARLNNVEGLPEEEQHRMLNGVKNYAQHCKEFNKVGTEYVMQAARFFGPNMEYLNEWPVEQNNKLSLPQRDEDLPTWAATNGYTQPRAGESWSEYRRRLTNELHRTEETI